MRYFQTINQMEHKKLILESKAGLIVVGSDWAVKDYVGQLGINWDWLERNNVGIAYFPRTKDYRQLFSRRKSKMPKVSLIIPTLHVGDNLERCISNSKDSMTRAES